MVSASKEAIIVRESVCYFCREVQEEIRLGKILPVIPENIPDDIAENMVMACIHMLAMMKIAQSAVNN